MSASRSSRKHSKAITPTRSKKNALSKLVAMNSEEDEDGVEDDREEASVSNQAQNERLEEDQNLDAAFASIAWMPQKSTAIESDSCSATQVISVEGKGHEGKDDKKSISNIRDFVEDIDEKRKLSLLYNKLSATAAAALECTNLL